MFDTRTMREQIDSTLMIERLSGVLAAAFATLALALAAVGLYGVLAFLVTRVCAKSAFALRWARARRG